MHELSIALGIIDIASQEATRHGCAVSAVHLKLGPLSGVSREALLASFEMARADTPLSDASLRIEDQPVTIQCSRCDTVCPVRSIQDMRCELCGTPSAAVVSGRELEVVALELLT